MRIIHEFGPYFNKDSKVLILGSLPSVKSREEGFYYAHPKNRFWSTLALVYHETIPTTIDDKKQFLNQHHIALWDVIESCEIKGSSDSSIKDVTPNDILSILKQTEITTIFTTGRKAYQLYNKYCYPKTKKEAIYLPSTSPANCPKNIEQILFGHYSKIKDFTEKQ